MKLYRAVGAARLLTAYLHDCDYGCLHVRLATCVGQGGHNPKHASKKLVISERQGAAGPAALALRSLEANETALSGQRRRLVAYDGKGLDRPQTARGVSHHRRRSSRVPVEDHLICSTLNSTPAKYSGVCPGPVPTFAFHQSRLRFGQCVVSVDAMSWSSAATTNATIRPS